MKCFVLLSALVLSVMLAPDAKAQICSPSVSQITFGVYNPLSPRPTDSMATVTVTCIGSAKIAMPVSYQIKFEGAGTRLRALNGPKGQAGYQLYTDPARTQVWGDCTGGTSCVSDSYMLGGSSSRRRYSVYSRIPAHQKVPPGLLTDVVMVTLDY